MLQLLGLGAVPGSAFGAWNCHQYRFHIQFHFQVPTEEDDLGSDLDALG